MTKEKSQRMTGYEVEVAAEHLRRMNQPLDFTDTYLLDADLKGADLRGANFRGVAFTGADLRGADLEDANLMYANLFQADLRDVKGLESVRGLDDAIYYGTIITSREKDIIDRAINTGTRYDLR
jgi:uncharacterized protein YjbI with pentapeptide repeats